MRSCLFLINGLGMGNTSRCDAVIRKLSALGFKVHVLTSGNGLAYFQGRSGIESLSEMASFSYGADGGQISGWSTVKTIGTLAKAARRKNRQLEELLQRVKPDIAVIDSEYAIFPLRRQRVPVVGLNTSEMVVTQYLKCRHVPPGIRSQFWFVEFFDYLFHRQFCDLVLSPFPARTPTRHRKFRRIGLIVREEVLKRLESQPCPPRYPAPREVREMVFMLSGSIHASNIQFASGDFPFNVHVVGRSGESRGKVTYHGRQMENAALLARADALVINGGYSAVSEAFALGKPVFVVPVPGHAEQFVNANLVRDFGLGFVANESNVLDQILTACDRNEWPAAHSRAGRFEIHGAEEAANAIASLAETGELHPRSIRNGQQVVTV